MGLKIYLDGKFVDEEEAKVSVFDHGFLYGDGVFEGIRAYHNSVFRLKDHVDRLYDSAKAVNMEIPVNEEQMSEIILESCRQNGLKDAYIRVVVYRGKGDLGLDPQVLGPHDCMYCVFDKHLSGRDVRRAWMSLPYLPAGMARKG